MKSTTLGTSIDAVVTPKPGSLTCPACDSTVFKASRVLPTVSFRRCLECGLLISTIEPVEPAAAEYSRVVEDRYARGLLAVRDRQSSELLGIIRRHNPAAETLVDVGCGFGSFLIPARAAGYRVRGVEPDEAAARKGRELLGPEVVQHGLLTPSTFPTSSADVVVTLDVLEHIPVDVVPGFVTTIRSVLRPGGIWVVKVPTSEGPFFRMAHLLRPVASGLVRGVLERLWQSRYEFPHTVYFNARSLRRLMERHGFTVEEVRYIEEVPSGTASDRLRFDDSVRPWQASLLAPGVRAINALGRLTRRTDAMVVVARAPKNGAP